MRNRLIAGTGTLLIASGLIGASLTFGSDTGNVVAQEVATATPESSMLHESTLGMMGMTGDDMDTGQMMEACMVMMDTMMMEGSDDGSMDDMMQNEDDSSVDGSEGTPDAEEGP